MNEEQQLSDLKAIIAKYRVCWDVYADKVVEGGKVEQDGFRLELYGTHPKGVDRVDPGCPRCIEVWDALHRIAEWIIPKEVRASRHQIDDFDRGIHYSRLRDARSDIELHIVIAHQSGFGPVDECENRCLGEMKDKLAELGAYQGRWRDSYGRRAEQTLLTLLLVLFGLMSSLNAQTVTPGPLDLGRLVQQVERENRELQMARRRWEAAAARPSQESAPPNPTVGFQSVSAGVLPLPGKSVGEEPLAFVSPMFMQDLPFPGKLKLRGEIAQKEADAAGRLYEATRLEVINDLKMAFFELYRAEKSIETVEKNKQLLTQLAEIARARYEVGSGLQQDVLKAQLETTMLEERLTMFRQKRDSMKAKINQLRNEPPDAPLGAVGDLEPSQLRYSLDQLYAVTEEANPVLGSRRSMVDRDARKLDLAKKQYMPDFNVRVGYMYMGGFTNLWDMTLGAQVPLYFWKKERKGVEEASADLRGSTNDYEATVQSEFREVKDQYLAVTTADRLMRLYKEAVIPQASLTLESSLSAYRVGSLDFLTILNNWTIVLNFELQYYEQLAMREAALANLEKLTGLQLVRAGGVK
jgi:outer membrane protein TolC